MLAPGDAGVGGVRSGLAIAEAMVRSGRAGRHPALRTKKLDRQRAGERGRLNQLHGLPHRRAGIVSTCRNRSIARAASSSGKYYAMVRRRHKKPSPPVALSFTNSPERVDAGDAGFEHWRRYGGGGAGGGEKRWGGPRGGEDSARKEMRRISRESLVARFRHHGRRSLAERFARRFRQCLKIRQSPAARQSAELGARGIKPRHTIRSGVSGGGARGEI